MAFILYSCFILTVFLSPLFHRFGALSGGASPPSAPEKQKQEFFQKLQKIVARNSAHDWLVFIKRAVAEKSRWAGLTYDGKVCAPEGGASFFSHQPDAYSMQVRRRPFWDAECFCTQKTSYLSEIFEYVFLHQYYVAADAGSAV